jgi:two-component system, LytTR family, sensor kinase
MPRYRQWALILAAWSVPGLISALSTVVFIPAAGRSARLLPILGISLIGWWTWAALTPGIVWIQRRYPVERHTLWRTLPTHAISALVCALLYVGTSLGTALLLFPEARSESLTPIARSYLSSRLPIGILLYAAVIGVATAFAERAERERREIQSAQLVAELAGAQARALQAQLQPHFLFNTLHTIGLLVAEDPAAAQRTLLQLGDLLRRTLTLSDVQTIPLRDELAVLREYLAIETTRFGARLQVVIDIPDALLSRRVPSLILQPLVENALRHGIALRISAGLLRVAADEMQGVLRLCVEDDGPGITGAAPRDGALGLDATRRRLSALHGANATLTAGVRVGGGTCISITLPATDA